MRNTVSMQLATGTKSRVATQRKLITSIILWTVQVVLALMFLSVGGMKLILPLQLLLAQMPLPLPGLFVRFIGLTEVAGGLGLLLPGLLRIRPLLTPLAALGLVLCLPVVTVAWLGFRLIEQDRALEKQRLADGRAVHPRCRLRRPRCLATSRPPSRVMAWRGNTWRRSS